MPEQLRDISIYLVDDRGNRTHLYDTTHEDNVISARVETDKVGRYSVEVVYHPQGRRERLIDMRNVVEIVASSDEESINGQPISTEIIGINLSADMVVSLSATTSTTIPPQTMVAVNRYGKLVVSYDDGENWETLMVDNVVLHDQQATIREVIAGLIAKTETPATTEVTYQGEKVPITFLAEELERTASELEYITTGLNTEVATKTDLSALEDKVTEIEGKTNTPQTKIRISEDGKLQVSYGSDSWEDVELGNVIIDQIHGTQIRDIAPIVTDIPVTRAEYGELQDRVNTIAGVDNLLSMIESIQFTPYPDLSSIPDEEHSNALAEQEMANRLPNSFVNQLLRLFNEAQGKTDRDPDIFTRIYDLEKKVKALENR